MSACRSALMSRRCCMSERHPDGGQLREVLPGSNDVAVNRGADELSPREVPPDDGESVAERDAGIAMEGGRLEELGPVDTKPCPLLRGGVDDASSREQL